MKIANRSARLAASVGDVVVESSSRRQARTKPASTCALSHDPPGRTEAPRCRRVIPARTSHGTCSGLVPPAAITACANAGDVLGDREQLVEAGLQAHRGPSRVHTVESGQALDLAPGAPQVKGVVEGSVEGPGSISQLLRPASYTAQCRSRGRGSGSRTRSLRHRADR